MHVRQHELYSEIKTPANGDMQHKEGGKGGPAGIIIEQKFILNEIRLPVPNFCIYSKRYQQFEY